MEENAKASNEKNMNEENDVRVKIVQKMQELHVMMCNLNHKLTYLESITKLKDLWICNLTSQTLENAVESEQFARKHDVQEKVKSVM